MAKILRKSDSSRKAFLQCCPILVPVIMTGIVFGAAPDQDVELQMQAAIQREIVVGDLKGAIELYKTILNTPGTPKSLAARALFQTAECFEKLGRHKEARDTYAKVVQQYGDQVEVATQARERVMEWDSSTSGPLNLQFDQGKPGKLPDAWFVPALPKDADHWAQLRHDGCLHHGSCGVVLVPENAPIRVGNLMQSFSAASYRGKTLRVTAWLRLEAVDPDDRAQMWVSVDRANDQKGFFDNMSDRPVRSNEWTKCEIQTKVDEDATFIKFGFLSIGRGRVWVDDVSVEVMSQTRSKP